MVQKVGLPFLYMLMSSGDICYSQAHLSTRRAAQWAKVASTDSLCWDNFQRIWLAGLRLYTLPGKRSPFLYLCLISLSLSLPDRPSSLLRVDHSTPTNKRGWQRLRSRGCQKQHSFAHIFSHSLAHSIERIRSLNRSLVCAFRQQVLGSLALHQGLKESCFEDLFLN